MTSWLQTVQLYSYTGLAHIRQ